MKNCTVSIHDDSMFEPEEQFRVFLGHPLGNHWSGARVGKNSMATITISNDEDGNRNSNVHLLYIAFTNHAIISVLKNERATKMPTDNSPALYL